MTTSITRRSMLKQSLAAAIGVAGFGRRASGFAADEFPPTRVITRGPKHHWFSYYDKFQFDPTNRYVLSMEVDFEHRSPRADDVIKIGMVDLGDGDKWTELGQSTAWCWQQGCMLQWIPGTQSKILWNDRQGDHYVCHILDVKTGQKRTVPHPIYSVSPDGKTAVAADFRRINDVRPGYGYVGLPDPFADNLAPKETGIFRIDLEAGTQELIIPIADVAKLGTIPKPQPDVKHYFNHLLFGPDGKRFIFLHRWKYPQGRWLTRMLTANADGSDIRVLDDNGLTSHFIWRDPKHILAQSRQPSHDVANYLFEDAPNGKITAVGPGVLDRGGHISYLPGNEWILNDTYPDKNRYQKPHLYNVKTGRRIEIGRFLLPKEYKGEWRCDTHPRLSRDGKLVCLDSPYKDEGRQLYLIDISGIVG